MSWLSELARADIRALSPYQHARWEPGLVRLHANELPWRAPCDESQAGLNRYPEPHPHELESRLALLYGVDAAWLLAGRGSDEAIDLLTRCFCQASRDAVLITPPTFGMYAVCARIQGAAVVEVPLRRETGFSFDLPAVRAALTQRDWVAKREGAVGPVKLVYLCAPNNPTGNSPAAATVLALARELEGRALLVVDEAYVEFSEHASLIQEMRHYPALVILRTLSKAYGLAGARCGAVIAAPEIIDLLRTIIPPYALAQLSIEAVFRTLQADHLAVAAERVGTIKRERERLAQALRLKGEVLKVWPSEANFLLVDFSDPGAVLERAHTAGLLVRDLRGSVGLHPSLRISVGTREHNEQLLASLS